MYILYIILYSVQCTYLLHACRTAAQGYPALFFVFVLQKMQLRTTKTCKFQQNIALEQQKPCCSIDDLLLIFLRIVLKGAVPVSEESLSTPSENAAFRPQWFGNRFFSYFRIRFFDLCYLEVYQISSTALHCKYILRGLPKKNITLLLLQYFVTFPNILSALVDRNKMKALRSLISYILISSWGGPHTLVIFTCGQQGLTLTLVYIKRIKNGKWKTRGESNSPGIYHFCVLQFM